MARRGKPTAPGFTLVEVLVALLVAAIIGLLSLRGLGALTDAQSRLDAEAARWLAVHRFLATLETDLRMALPRPARDAGGTLQPALLGAPAPAPPFDAQLAFVQSVELAALPVRRVAYRFADGRIDVLRWPAADLPPYGAPAVVPGLAGVRAFALRYLGADGVWREAWAPAQGGELPRGFEVRLEMADPAFGGPIERVIAR
jgi:general secretion pathway protein J